MLLFSRDDDSAQDDVLAGYKDDEGGNSGQHECGIDDRRVNIHAELENINHDRPHLGIGSEDESIKEGSVGRDEDIKGRDCEDGLGNAKLDLIS